MAEKNEQLREQVADLIVQYVDTDEKLPTEQELMTRFGVSRSALRDVLSEFETNGIIVSQQGSGRVARYPNMATQISSTWISFVKHKPALLLDFLEVRRSLELSALPVAIRYIKPDDLLQLHGYVDAMLECARAGQPFDKYDRNFHGTLFACTGNMIFAQLLTAFWDICENSFTWPANDDPVKVAQLHADILEAVACQNEEEAVRLLDEQFTDSRNQIMLALISGRQSA